MIKQFWINLPVKDVKKSKKFFSKLGFSFNPSMSDDKTFVCLLAGSKEVPIMLFEESAFKGSTLNELTNTERSTEVLLSLDAENRKEVDKIAQKVKAVGGIVYSAPAEIQGWMYGCGFIDLDGHRWHILYRG